MIFDIVVLAIVVLGALIGLWKGFFKTLIAFFGWFMSMLASFFLTKIVAEALLDVASIRQFVLGTEGWSFFNWIYAKLPDLDGANGVLAVVLKPILKVAEAGGGDLKISVAALIANGLFNIIVFIGLLIAIRLILLLFTMFANAMTKNKLVGGINRLLGLLMGAVRGGVFVVVVMAIMSFIMSFNFMAPVRAQLDSSVISRRVFEPVNNVTHKFLSGDNETLTKLLHYLGFDPEIAEDPYTSIAGDYKNTTENDGVVTEYKFSLDAKGNFTRDINGSIRQGTFALDDKKEILVFTYTSQNASSEEDGTVERDTARMGDGWFYLETWEMYFAKDGITPPDDQKNPDDPETPDDQGNGGDEQPGQE